mgnify:CR=1 FL=1
MAGFLAFRSWRQLTFPARASGILSRNSLITVAGAATAFNRVPYQAVKATITWLQRSEHSSAATLPCLRARSNESQ